MGYIKTPGGKKFRVKDYKCFESDSGNIDRAWEISLYHEAKIAGLKPGQVISAQLGDDPQFYTMIIVKLVEVVGEFTGISLSCAADSATSYPAT